MDNLSLGADGNVRGDVGTERRRTRCTRSKTARCASCRRRTTPGCRRSPSRTSRTSPSRRRTATIVNGLLVKPAIRAGRQAPDDPRHSRRPERPGRARVRPRARDLRGQRLRGAADELPRQLRPRRRSSRRPSSPTGATTRWSICSRAWTTRVASGVADPDRLGIGGWSYGGILTDYTIATDHALQGRHLRRRQRAAALDVRRRSVHRAVRDRARPAVEDAGPCGSRCSYPFFHADRIKTPTLFMGGDKDFNVPLVGARADVPGAQEQRRRHAAGRLPGPAPRPVDSELPARSARALGGVVRQISEGGRGVAGDVDVRQAVGTYLAVLCAGCLVPRAVPGAWCQARYGRSGVRDNGSQRSSSALSQNRPDISLQID